MRKAGFCSDCNGIEWLRPDGSCFLGHPRESMRNVGVAKVDPEIRRPVGYVPMRPGNPEGAGTHRLSISLASVTTQLTPARAIGGAAVLLLGLIVVVSIVWFVFDLVFRFVVFPVVFSVLLVLTAADWGIGGFSW